MTTYGQTQCWSPSEIDQRFRLAVKRETARRSFTIEPHCEDILQSFIGQGVTNLLNRGLQSDAFEIDLAESLLVAFIIKMMIEARDSSTPFELHEPTFARASSFLCPCWPFC
jgi:hypothetical protein